MSSTACPTPAPPSPPTIVSILRWAPLPSEPVTRSRSDQSNTQLGRTPGLRQPRTRGPCHHVNVTCLSHVQFRVDTCRHCASCRDRCESRQCYCQRYRDRIQCVKKQPAHWTALIIHSYQPIFIIIVSSMAQDTTRQTMYDKFQPWVLATYGDSAKTKTITLKKARRISKLLMSREKVGASRCVYFIDF